MTDRTTIIERIKALRAKANDAAASVDEAASAAAMAAKLLTKYEVSPQELREREESAGAAERFRQGKILHPVADYLAVSLASFTETRVYQEHGELVFVGVDSDVEMAIYLTEMLVATAKRMWLDIANDLNVGFKELQHKRQSFFLGFTADIRIRLARIMEERLEQRKSTMSSKGSSDLVVVKDSIIQNKLDEMGIKLYKAKRRQTFHPDRDSYASGAKAASNVNLNRPMSDYTSSFEELV